MKKFLTMTALLLLTLHIAFSEKSYDLSQIVELTLKENATIKRNNIELRALKRKSDKRWASIVPSLSADVSATKTGEKNGYVNAATATSALTISPSSFSDIGQARLNYETGLVATASKEREVELSVRKSFFLILYEQEYVDYLRQTVTTAKRQYEQTLASQQAGLIPILDTLTAEVNYQNAILALASAESSRRNDVATLKQAAGIPQAEDIRLNGSLDSSLPKYLLNAEKLRPSSPSHEVLRKNLEAALFARKMAATSVWAPTLSCSVGTKNFLSSADSTTGGLIPTMTMAISFPISNQLPWSATKESALAADDTVRDIELQMNEIRTADSSKYESLLQDIRDAERTIKTRRLTVSLAEESYRLTEEAFREGSKDFLSVKNAADALQEAQIGLMKEAYSLISASMDLEYLCGAPFGYLSEEK